MQAYRSKICAVVVLSFPSSTAANRYFYICHSGGHEGRMNKTLDGMGSTFSSVLTGQHPEEIAPNLSTFIWIPPKVKNWTHVFVLQRRGNDGSTWVKSYYNRNVPETWKRETILHCRSTYWSFGDWLASTNVWVTDSPWEENILRLIIQRDYTPIMK